MDYEKKYKEALANMQELYNSMKYMSSTDALHTTMYLEKAFPELKKSEDEKIRQWLIGYFNQYKDDGMEKYANGLKVDDILAWLEKQKVTDEEIIFRPVVGTDIRIAAKQALEKIDIGKKVVLAFNGAYIPVNGKTVGEIDSEYDAWLKKQSDINETINMNEFAQGVLRGAAINLITWIDYNTAKGNMCLSNMECKVIEDALVSGDWDKIYAYIKRKLEKQGESNFEQSIQDGDNVVTNEDGTHFNVSQLERVAKKATETEETAKEFLKSAEIVDKNGKLADEYRLEKQGGNSATITKCNNSITNAKVVSHPTITTSTTIEPKFKEGDWIIFNGLTLYVREVVKGFYRTISIDGITNSYDWSIDNAARLWTIQDAKDGDVLATPNYIYIFNSIYKEIETVAFYCLMKKSDEHFSFGDYRIHDEILNSIPATKEQRNLLFSKMKEAGYEWNAEKKKLGKRVIDEGKSEMDYCFTKMMNGEKVRSVWSKDDEDYLLDVNFAINDCFDKGYAEELRNWLKSLKERMKGE